MAEASYNLKKLLVWSKAVDFVELIHKSILPLLPNEEKWGLRSQLSRSSQSIPANIAEGYGCYYYQENIHFCFIARGSLEESYSHLLVAARLGYLPNELICQVEGILADIRRLLNGYIEYLKKSKTGENEPGSPQTQHQVSEMSVIYQDWETPESLPQK